MPHRYAAVVVVAAAIACLTGCGMPAAGPDSTRARPGEATVAAAAEAVDGWAGHFDDRAAAFPRASSAGWGSFGAAGEVVATRDSNASLAPGRHVVFVECAGSDTVTATLIPGDGAAAHPDVVTYDLACPSGASLTIDTTVPGLTVDVDSHGDPGAFLYAVDPVA